jgi:hypothetical protein
MLDGTPGNVKDLLDAHCLMMEQQVEQYSVTVNIVSNMLTQLGRIQEVGLLTQIGVIEYGLDAGSDEHLIEITNQNIGTKQSENDHPCRDKSHSIQGWACTHSTCIFINLNTLLMQLNIGLELVVLNLMFLLHARDD